MAEKFLSITAKQITAFDDPHLNSLMQDLLKAQAMRCKADLSQVHFSTEEDATDDGSDAKTPKPEVADEWLGDAETCWQFKAGRACEANRLKDEVLKRIPRETLQAGGRFVVVASACANGEKGIRTRRKVLQAEASEAGLPADKIDVIGADGLFIWANQHPAVAILHGNRPGGLWALSEWEKSPLHREPWQSTPAIDRAITTLRGKLDFAQGDTWHVHVQGPPGVGKSRFALELCRGAGWSDVIYVHDAYNYPGLVPLIDEAAATEGLQLMIAIDEVQASQLVGLRDALDKGEGRVRLVTIGHCKTPDPTRIPAHTVAPLEREQMRSVIRGWYPAMPFEHVDFVVRFADGYVKLARLAAERASVDPEIDVRGLLSLDYIKQFLDKMLGGEKDRRYLYVVSSLTSVGWTKGSAAEGEAIARHMGWDWTEVCAAVEDFHSHYEIVPSGGNRRYISPTPLGAYLAVEAWTRYPEQMRSLPSVLPTEDARRAYYERLRTIASNPSAGAFAREQLAFFFQLEHFLDPEAVRRWSALSVADPAAATRNIRGALSEVPPEERSRLPERARRELVWALVALAWEGAAFHDSVMALALLAEAETEPWANNATSEFVARFQMILGGRAVPYMERLSVLDELLETQKPAFVSLVTKALGRVWDEQPVRMGGGPSSDELPEREWYPRRGDEALECVREAFKRLEAITRLKLPTVEEDLLAAAKHLASLLSRAPVREIVASFYSALRANYPETREELRRAIQQVVYREKQLAKELPEEEIRALEALQADFEEHTLEAQLRQKVGPALWDPSEPVDLTPLAESLYKDREALEAQWPWLTSGEAMLGWQLGEALPLVDTSRALDSVLPALKPQGPDLRVLCGYVSVRRRALGDQWFDAWMGEEFRRDPPPVRLLLEVTYRCGVTVNTARALSALVRTRDLKPEEAAFLEFGVWWKDLPGENLADLLDAFYTRGHERTAIAALTHRLEDKPQEKEQWHDLALKLVTNEKVVQSGQMAGYFWKQTAVKLVPRHAREIAAAIFRAQLTHESQMWFIEHSDAREVLFSCVKQDPLGVWQELRPYFESDRAHYFKIGFPSGVVDLLPESEILDWIGQDLDDRAPLVMHLVVKDVSRDEALAARLLESFGSRKHVAEAFLAEYASGSWIGPASGHWSALVKDLKRVAANTRLTGVRRWVRWAIPIIQKMVDDAREQEEEERLKWQ
jgi:hypothetical protein